MLSNLEYQIHSRSSLLVLWLLRGILIMWFTNYEQIIYLWQFSISYMYMYFMFSSAYFDDSTCLIKYFSQLYVTKGSQHKLMILRSAWIWKCFLNMLWKKNLWGEPFVEPQLPVVDVRLGTPRMNHNQQGECQPGVLGLHDRIIDHLEL